MTLPSDILVDQYRRGDIAELVDAIGAVIRARLAAPTAAVGENLSIDADGVWLDYIGQRLGFARPLTATGEFFGFDDAGVGFDLRGFTSPAARHASRVGVGDKIYRQLLRARGVYLLGGADGETVTSILELLFERARVEDSGILDAILHIPSDADDLLQLVVNENLDSLIPRPTGVAYTMAADL